MDQIVKKDITSQVWFSSDKTGYTNFPRDEGPRSQEYDTGQRLLLDHSCPKTRSVIFVEGSNGRLIRLLSTLETWNTGRMERCSKSVFSNIPVFHYSGLLGLGMEHCYQSRMQHQIFLDTDDP
jgi:hypothetical protein